MRGIEDTERKRDIELFIILIMLYAYIRGFGHSCTIEAGIEERENLGRWARLRLHSEREVGKIERERTWRQRGGGGERRNIEHEVHADL